MPWQKFKKDLAGTNFLDKRKVLRNATRCPQGLLGEGWEKDPRWAELLAGASRAGHLSTTSLVTVATRSTGLPGERERDRGAQSGQLPMGHLYSNTPFSSHIENYFSSISFIQVKRKIEPRKCYKPEEWKDQEGESAVPIKASLSPYLLNSSLRLQEHIKHVHFNTQILFHIFVKNLNAKETGKWFCRVGMNKN